LWGWMKREVYKKKKVDTREESLARIFYAAARIYRVMESLCEPDDYSTERYK
jgi:hypothetical protein